VRVVCIVYCKLVETFDWGGGIGVCLKVHTIGAPLLGNMEGCSFPRAFERREKFLYLGKF
jgi:hypothetical protein